MLKNEIESYVRTRGRGLKNLTYSYMGVGGSKIAKNNPYIITEWPLNIFTVKKIYFCLQELPGSLNVYHFRSVPSGKQSI